MLKVIYDNTIRMSISDTFARQEALDIYAESLTSSEDYIYLTGSELFISVFRLCVKQGVIDINKVFLGYAKNNSIIQINLLPTGLIQDWPRDFCCVLDNTLRELLC